MKLKQLIAQLRNVSGRTPEEAKAYLDKANELELQLSDALKIEEKQAQGRILTEREKMMHRRARWQYDRAIEHLKARMGTFGYTDWYARGPYDLRNRPIDSLRQRYKNRSADPNRDFSEFIGHLCSTDAEFKARWNSMSKEQRKEWRRINWDHNLLPRNQ